MSAPNHCRTCLQDYTQSLQDLSDECTQSLQDLSTWVHQSLQDLHMSAPSHCRTCLYECTQSLQDLSTWVHPVTAGPVYMSAHSHCRTCLHECTQSLQDLYRYLISINLSRMPTLPLTAPAGLAIHTSLHDTNYCLLCVPAGLLADTTTIQLSLMLIDPA